MDLEFFYAFGAKCNAKQNFAFYNDKTLIFIVGKLCVLLDVETHTQKLIRITEDKEITSISRCYNHLALAVQGNPPSVCLFNIESETKKLYSGPQTMASERFTCITISRSLKFLAAVGGAPDWLIVLWLSNTREMIATFCPTVIKPDSFINGISFHAGGREEVVIVGKNILRLYECQDEENSEDIIFSEVVFEKYENEVEYTSISWPQKENLAVGTTNGKVLFFRGIELVKEISVAASLADIVNVDTIAVRGISTSFKPVNALAVSPEELFCVFGGNIVVSYKGKGISENGFNKLLFLPASKEFTVLPGGLPKESSVITHLVISPNNQIIATTTNTGEVYYLDCSERDAVSSDFRSLLPVQHAGRIRTISVSRGRFLVATCSEGSIILWNYHSRRQEMYLRFKDEILSLSLHPTGLYLAVSFKFYSRVFTIVCNGLKDKKTLRSKNCSKIIFSNGGHFLALANEVSIEVYSFIEFSLLAKLKGHAGPITDLVWKDNDARFVSCDAHGVICEWDVVTWSKIWENTALLSYSVLTITPNDNSIIAVCKEKIIKCLRDSLVVWESKCPKEISSIVSNCNGETLYAGANDGCMGRLSIGEPNSFFEMHAHSEGAVKVIFNFDFTYLFSVGCGSIVFCWKVSGASASPTKGMFSSAAFMSVSDFEDQKERLELLRMAIEQSDMCYECDIKLNQRKHEETMKKLYVEHESTIGEFNQTISRLCEEKQVILFDSYCSDHLKDVENEHKRKNFQRSHELDKAYRKTDEYALETRRKVENYESIFENMEESYDIVRTDNDNTEDIILSKIREIENTLAYEKATTLAKLATFEREKERLRAMSEAEVASMKASQTAKSEEEQLKIEELKKEIKKLANMVSFAVEDVHKKQDIVSGQIDFDIREKLNRIRVLKEELNIREKELKTKQRMFQDVDMKFGRLRRVIGNLRRSQSVSRSAVEQVKSSTLATESEIEFCKKEIEEVVSSVPKIEEAIQTASEQCLTLSEKLKDTVDGFRQKQTLFRDAQNIFSKYTYLLSESLSPTCDAEKLKQDILQVLVQYQNRSDDALDPNLRAEFSHQIRKLQSTYRDIKDDPSETVKNLSVAEFKLSQENSKLLNEVHKIQKEAEKLQRIIFGMEVSMGMPHSSKTKPTTKTENLRNKIEQVVISAKKTKAENANEIARLDRLIEEQQNELQRLRSLVSEKEKNKHSSKK